MKTLQEKIKTMTIKDCMDDFYDSNISEYHTDLTEDTFVSWEFDDEISEIGEGDCIQFISCPVANKNDDLIDYLSCYDILNEVMELFDWSSIPHFDFYEVGVSENTHEIQFTQDLSESELYNVWEKVNSHLGKYFN